MSSSLLDRSRKPFRHVDHRDSRPSQSSGPAQQSYENQRHATADFTEADDDVDDTEDFDRIGSAQHNEEEVDDEEEDEEEGEEQEEQEEDEGEDIETNGLQDGRRAALPVLPLFSSTHLESLPVYSITHAIRIIVSARTETTLTWEQLRSPQVSQFLVKPMQQQIRAQHFSRATLYALMANSLQFAKEGQRYAGNAGSSSTRALVCELLAIKLLKEYNTRELIDALAYDFYPLQGIPVVQPSTPLRKTPPMGSNLSIASRTSTLEVAIRASAKHFLAHPLVVQQLEAIWSGAITFHSSADSLHREATSLSFPTSNGHVVPPDARTPLLGSLPHKERSPILPPGRRRVTLYDPRQASLFKLSRLRVPRYRSFLSTLSLAVLIGLFLAVLIQRSVQITGLELVFWFWSAGFMLDELVGFNEQGFALYIMSFWNIFDLGILVLLIVYYFMRAYGVFLVDPHHWNDMAYDVLAANAILLLPRIFSVLDHSRYFSQLLIAFRLMAVDLAAVFVVIFIACSGFFVFFTLSKNAEDAPAVAYKIFQIVMGFTPAAWDVWPTYNILGRVLLGLFLIICHFLVVTILITVLTNSFTAIATNANEEHQFLFAINTISMVKNDALFSYIAPTNIFAWLLMPFRYCMPLKQFVWLNRTVIKATHFPLLFFIFLYEKLWLASSMFEPTDLVENPGRGRNRVISLADPTGRTALFSPNPKVREESVTGFQKDRALEEVFRRMPDPVTLRTQRRHDRRKTQTAIRNWMDQHEEDRASPSNYQSLEGRAVPDWQRRLSVGLEHKSSFRRFSDVRSTASDPISHSGLLHRRGRGLSYNHVPEVPEYKDQTDADGDDELVTNDEDEEDMATNTVRSHPGRHGTIVEEPVEDYFNTAMAYDFGKLASSASSAGKAVPPTPKAKRLTHNRTMSSTTILFNPQEMKRSAQASSSISPPQTSQGHTSQGQTSQGRSKTSGRGASGEKTPTSGHRGSPLRPVHIPNAKPRPAVSRTETGGVSRISGLSKGPQLRPRETRRLSSMDLSIMSDPSNLHYDGGDPNAGLAGSFQTQMVMAMMKDSQLRAGGGLDSGDRDRMSRLVLARMKNLEESFAEVVKEVRYLKTSSTTPTTTRRNSSGDDSRPASVIEVAGPDRSKKYKTQVNQSKDARLRRPVSRRSTKGSKVETWDTRGKGKAREVAYSSDDDETATDDEAMVKGGSQ